MPTPVPGPALSQAGREQALIQALAELADTLVDDYDVIDVLTRLASHCASLLDIAAAGLLVDDGTDQLNLLAASSEQAELHRLLGLHHQGLPTPCLECYRSGRPVAAAGATDLHRRWPTFADRAATMGCQAVQAVPMRLRRDTIGTLILLRTSPATLGADDLALATALADVATIGILHRRALDRSETLVEQLSHALHSRITIEQAKGVLAATAGITPDQAFHLLRSHARTTRQHLHSLAAHAINNPTARTSILSQR